MLSRTCARKLRDAIQHSSMLSRFPIAFCTMSSRYFAQSEKSKCGPLTLAAIEIAYSPAYTLLWKLGPYVVLSRTR